VMSRLLSGVTQLVLVLPDGETSPDSERMTQQVRQWQGDGGLVTVVTARLCLEALTRLIGF